MAYANDRNYADPKFGSEKPFNTDVSASLASTVGATEIMRYRMKNAGTCTAVTARIKTGGTDAVRKVLVGISLAGTGAFAGFGTATLGTQADKTTKDLSITGSWAAGDDLVFQHLGTGGEAWVVGFTAWYQDKFVQA